MSHCIILPRMAVADNQLLTCFLRTLSRENKDELRNSTGFFVEGYLEKLNSYESNQFFS